ncbi:hypothetical protein ABZ078_37165 [Streptomyces sp. NPDC006385]|uniref:hypothetical protein n=1 Tax=Streptomyces sp. NPDC006385 TaxID=3156761 RepID=UPI0033B230EF
MVSPTEALTRQWVDKAAQFGVALNPDVQGSKPLNQSREFVGGSVTYGLLASKKETAVAFSKAMQIRRTLVILDEAHHTGENKAWGIAVQTTFELARHRLLLTGTPTRSDMDRIPFARYRQDPDGVRRIVRDYDYGTGRGVRDHVIRSLDFRFYDAKVNELPFGETVPMSANISEAVSRSDHSKFMGVVMGPDSGWFSETPCANSPRALTRTSSKSWHVRRRRSARRCASRSSRRPHIPHTGRGNTSPQAVQVRRCCICRRCNADSGRISADCSGSHSATRSPYQWV